jgi:hypothetical protein
MAQRLPQSVRALWFGGARCHQLDDVPSFQHRYTLIAELVAIRVEFFTETINNISIY